MKLQRMLSLFCIMWCIHYVVAVSGTTEDMTNLMDTLFSNYRRDIRPAHNLNDTVTVQTLFFLLSIRDLDEVSGTITLSGGISMIWKDFRLSWNSSDHAGITNVMVNSSKIWKPSIYLVSSASDLKRFRSDEFDSRIYHNGHVTTSPGKTMKATCEIDMTYFPMDSQKCSLLVSPWEYHTEEIHLTVLSPKFWMDYYNPNGEWDVEDTSAEAIPGHSGEASHVVYNLFLKRKPSYFIMSLIIPVYTLCFMSPFVFLLPATSGERMSYTMTMFLSLAVYMTLVGDNMPKVSKPISGISYFLLISMVFSCLLVILTIFSLRCGTVTDITKFPKCVRWGVLKLGNRRRSRTLRTCNHDADDAVEAAYQIRSTSDPNVIGHKTEHGEKDATATDKDEPDICDVTKVIDFSLFALTETIALGLILGFALVYYK